MSPTLFVLLVFTGIGLGVWSVSYLVEALRRAPLAPTTLRWAPEIPIRSVVVGGARVRYIMAGAGPPLVLLHTLRTQLDLFEQVVPELARSFTVYALDFPGHGYSAIPRARYDAAFFARAVKDFLEALDLRAVTLAGVSIGGSVALSLAGQRNPRIGRVMAINPYDYGKGRGLGRSSPAARLLMLTARVPVLGETIMRLRTFGIIKAVLRGGVVNPQSISSALLRELYLVGNRRGYSRAFLSLLRTAESWEDATADYHAVAVPVLLIWGDRDWARPTEREHDRDLLPGVQMVMVEGGGHFLPLDRPDAVIEQIRNFALGRAETTEMVES
jgi:pimeloyl-ACP methyl ester carboxylesterase